MSFCLLLICAIFCCLRNILKISSVSWTALRLKMRKNYYRYLLYILEFVKSEQKSYMYGTRVQYDENYFETNDKSLYICNEPKLVLSNTVPEKNISISALSRTELNQN